MKSRLSSFPTETVVLHKNDGSTQKVAVLVSGDEVFCENVNVNIEEGETFERTLPNGSTEYFRVIDRGYFSGSHSIPAHYQCKVKKENIIFIQEDERATIGKRPRKLFISHSSKDREYVLALTELLEKIGMPDDSIVCTSAPGHGIPSGENIFNWLRNQFQRCNLRVMFVLSRNYYKSPACLNEMGAAWVTKATDTLFLLPGFQFSSISGCVDSNKVGISFESDDEELKHRLNELKDTLISEHCLPAITQVRWDRARDQFIKKVREIANAGVNNRKRNV